MKAVADAADVAIAVRGDDYGKLEGCWVTEIGPLNQVMYLWSCADRNETCVPASRRGLMVTESRIMVLLYVVLFASAASAHRRERPCSI